MVQLNSFFSSAFSRQAIDRLFQRLPSNSDPRNVQNLARPRIDIVSDGMIRIY
ncbi:MAG: hypothetical protein ACFCUR_04195 [Rhodomicrobiaceae bacterium]